MSESRYKFSKGQIECLKALEQHRYSCSRDETFPPEISLADKFDNAARQSLRNACVATAAVSLVEYYEDCRSRLSVQYLIEATHLIERDWLDRNIAALINGGKLENDFSVAFAGQIAQIRMLEAANAENPGVVTAFVDLFRKQVEANIDSESGTRIRRTFEALEKYGVCRYRVWPYANVAANVVGAAEGGSGEFPPGAHEDARKHRVLNGLYLLRAPNNVDEIRGIISGANARRPMPVCVGVDLFDGCDGEIFSMPRSEDGERIYKGVHEMLLVGYRNDPGYAGGGYFTVRNSWGEDWGNGGYGKIPYAYIECFCREAGTILQEMVDYAGEKWMRNGADSAVINSSGVTKLPHSAASREVCVRRARGDWRVSAIIICLSIAFPFCVQIGWWLAHKDERSGATSQTGVCGTLDLPKGLSTMMPEAMTAATPESPDVDNHKSIDLTRKDRPDEDSFEVEAIAEFRYEISIGCDSEIQAQEVSRLLHGEHDEFTGEMAFPASGRKSFSGKIVIEAPKKHPPNVRAIIEKFLDEKILKNSVRLLFVKRLSSCILVTNKNKQTNKGDKNMKELMKSAMLITGAMMTTASFAAEVTEEQEAVAKCAPREMKLMVASFGTINSQSEVENWLGDQLRPIENLEKLPALDEADKVANPNMAASVVRANWNTRKLEYMKSSQEIERENARRMRILTNLKTATLSDNATRYTQLGRDYLQSRIYKKVGKLIKVVDRGNMTIQQVEKGVGGKSADMVNSADCILSVVMGDREEDSKTIPIDNSGTKIKRTKYTAPYVGKIRDLDGNLLIAFDGTAEWNFEQNNVVKSTASDPARKLVEAVCDKIADRVVEYFTTELKFKVKAPKGMDEDDVEIYVDGRDVPVDGVRVLAFEHVVRGQLEDCKSIKRVIEIENDTPKMVVKFNFKKKVVEDSED